MYLANSGMARLEGIKMARLQWIAEQNVFGRGWVAVAFDTTEWNNDGDGGPEALVLHIFRSHPDCDRVCICREDETFEEGQVVYRPDVQKQLELVRTTRR